MSKAIHRTLQASRKIIQLQLIIGFSIAVLFLVTKHSLNSFISSACGVVVSIVATVIYTKIAFANGMVLSAKDVYAKQKLAMVVRFLVNLSLLAVIFATYRNCDTLALLVTYCATFLAYWLIIKKADGFIL